jgi:hypothetical protein
MKAFPKTPQKVMTVTIDENGDLLMLKSDAADVFLEGAEVVTKRASHVEPYDFWLRILFHILRSCVKDDSALAAWTRTWRCYWRVNTAPVGGPILTWADIWRANGTVKSLPMVKRLSQYNEIAAWHDRQKAIDNEVMFLNTYFLERGIQ